jgi:uncharacterized repeat protein (TIGR01451 family)
MNLNGKASRIVSLLITLTLALAVLFILAAVTGPAAANDEGQTSSNAVWLDVQEADIVLQGERLIVPDSYRPLRLNPDALTTILQAASLEFSTAADPVVLSLPLPDGGFSRFQIVESPVMAPELAAKFPEIKTYAGRGLDEPAAITRFDWTPHGFHAMILSPEGTVYIDPFSRNDTTHYLSYAPQDYQRDTGFVELGPLGDNTEVEGLLTELRAAGSVLSSGDELRTYRLAMAATGEYTQFHGGTVPDALAAIVTAMNRVNGIYERDVAVRMELIANNDLIIYTNGATDPYTNNNGFLMLGENQTNLDAVIGNPNYDIGHVFSTGGGGIASLGVPCRTGLKARGVTGLSSPIGDPFYVDYVAHEIGHQYGANHTFNGNAGSCAGNRNASTAYEPGSGTTIMAYAGICGSQNIQPNSDDHFHTESIDEMRAYTVAGSGNSCATITTTGNSPPVVDGGSDYTIPLDTPFTLTGSATDPESDPLTYNWEQFDLGPAGHPNSPVGNAPLFRSFSSLATPSRTFPQITDIVNNTQTIGEILPFYDRGMIFRFTVRDNNVAPSAGGVASDQVEVTVTDSAGPFLVTAPNTAVTWSTGTLEHVTWDVANTDLAPVSCAAVDLRLSTDGGFTYPVTLASGVPNDGSEMVTVPIELTTSARVQVSCADNIFFDISDADFTIEAGFPFAALSISKLVEPAGAVSLGQALTYTVAVTNSGNLTATASVTDTFSAGLTGVTCEGVPGDLMVVQDIPPAGQASFECTAQVDSGLGIDLHKAVDRPIVGEGEAVTYTLTVTNPHGALTMTNVLVSDPLVGTCLPALGVPFDLGPGASQAFVCPGVGITGTVTNTASVTAEFLIANQAVAAAPEDPSGPVSSGFVTSPVAVAASAEVTVELAPVYYLFLPAILRN